MFAPLHSSSSCICQMGHYSPGICDLQCLWLQATAAKTTGQQGLLEHRDAQFVQYLFHFGLTLKKNPGEGECGSRCFKSVLLP